MRRRRETLAGLLLACLLGNSSGAAHGANVLRAASAKVDITPDLSRHRIYMAGFGATGRKPEGVHDPLFARILVLSDGALTVGIVGLDLLGFYRNDVEDLRRLSGFDAPGRYLFVSATHQHSGPDTLALWGPYIGVSGVNADYHKELKEKVAAKLRELSAPAEPVALGGFSAPTDPRGLCRDLRDPVVIDPFLGALTFRASKGRTVATIVNWSCHPEVLGKDNRLLTADYPGPLCRRLEERLGGTCVFLPGAIGGLMSPDAEESFAESERVGLELAQRVLKGLSRAGAPAKAPRLAASSQTILIPVENSRYLGFLPALAFGHRLLDSRRRPLPWWKTYWLPLKHALLRLGAEDRPWVESEVSLLRIGPAQLLGIPGELFPELAIGGYDGRYRAGHPLVAPDNPNPPDLRLAPQGPYLRDRMTGSLKLIVGLANDELGYIVPAYDFKIQPTLTLLPRLPGHHYEETNSIGVFATRVIIEAAAGLLTPTR